MKFTIRTLIWTLVLIAIIVASYMAMIPKPIEVETAQANEGSLLVTVREDGITRIREKYVVSAPVAGRLSRIKLHEGDEISSEDALIAVILPSEPAILDSRTRAEADARVQAATASLKRSKAESQQARITHELNQKKYERAKKLLPQRAISPDEFDIVKAEFLASGQAIKTSAFESEIAEFELQMARAAADQLGDSAKESSTTPFEIFSPVKGKVLRVFQESSTVVSVGTPLVEIGDPEKLELEIDVLSTDATQIRPGSELTIEHWGGKSPLKGHVRVIEPAAFTKVSSLGVEEQRVNIIADFEEPADQLVTLGDGYRVEARITIEEIENAILVPNSALFRFERRWHVLTVVDGMALMKPVKLGQQNETHTQILEGLMQGESVIVYPSDEIETGTPVKTPPVLRKQDNGRSG